MRINCKINSQVSINKGQFRLRCLKLLGEPSASAEKKLSFSQIAALRFADDREFIILLSRALNEKLSGDQLKRSIQNWQADYMRR